MQWQTRLLGGEAIIEPLASLVSCALITPEIIMEIWVRSAKPQPLRVFKL
jgi:hypothetical protein